MVISGEVSLTHTNNKTLHRFTSWSSYTTYGYFRGGKSDSNIPKTISFTSLNVSSIQICLDCHQRIIMVNLKWHLGKIYK
jgi:hypothetical protein